MRVGVIGTGNMGTMIIQSLIDSKAIPPENLYITNRTLNKAIALKSQYPTLHVVTSELDCIEQADLIFICIKPLDFPPLIKRMKEVVNKDQCIISITSPIRVDDLEKTLNCSCARAIPSITNRAQAGVCLMTFGEKCTDEWKKKIMQLISKIGKPIEIEENIVRVASDIVSCGPAFLSYLIQQFIKSAVRKTEIDESLATTLASEMLIGMGALIKENYYSFQSLQEKVTVRGGITGEGLKVLEQSHFENSFDDLFEATYKKFQNEQILLKKQFDS